MLKAGKTGSGVKKCASTGCMVSKSAKTNNGAGAAGAPTLPFVHRTPTQLHASTYALKRG